MAFTEQEKQIIIYGKANGKTQQEVEQALVRLRTGTPVVQKPIEKPDYLSRVGSELKTAGTGYLETTERGAELTQEGKPIQGAIMAGLGAVGSFIRGVFSPITAAIAPTIQEKLKESGVTDNVEVQKVLKGIDEWAKANPDLAKNSQNLLEIVTALIGVKGVTSAIPVIKTGAESVEQGIKTGVKAIAEAPVVQGTIDVTKMAVEGVSRIPSKIATNVAQKQAEVATIKSLPTKIAQKAAQDGIDPVDVKVIYSIPKETKSASKELADTVIKFSKGDTKIDPIEIVGKPIKERLKILEKLRGTVGQKLGVVAETLGTVTSKEMVQPVFLALQKVSGLSGIKLGKNGVLDFSDTVLTTAETAVDRKAIQSIFTQATMGGTGKSKHLLRQELFEILGGKKRASIQLTETQDKAYQAIRQGLSGVLETKNSTYKELSNQYRKIIKPLSDMRKTIKAVPGVTEDILDMNAGLIARRLTSTSLSQGQIRTILQAMDNVTKVKGTTQATTESLQNLYNVLGKYYDIAPKTGFQGQVKAGVESASGLGETIVGAVKKVMGETPVVRQKAIESVLKEALGI